MKTRRTSVGLLRVVGVRVVVEILLVGREESAWMDETQTGEKDWVDPLPCNRRRTCRPLAARDGRDVRNEARRKREGYEDADERSNRIGARSNICRSRPVPGEEGRKGEGRVSGREESEDE
jgi:hypothetical protein